MSVTLWTAAWSKKSCVLHASSGFRENRPTRTVITRSLLRSDSTHRKPLSLEECNFVGPLYESGFLVPRQTKTSPTSSDA